MDGIYDQLFSFEGNEIEINRQYRTPPMLRVDRASRRIAIPLYYHNRTFHTADFRLLIDFLCRLDAGSAKHLDTVRLDFIDTDSQRILRMRYVIHPQRQVAQAQHDEARIRVWEVIDKLSSQDPSCSWLGGRQWNFIVAQAWTEKDGVLEAGQLHRFGDREDMLEVKRRSQKATQLPLWMLQRV